jgi:hypothetical protein
MKRMNDGMGDDISAYFCSLVNKLKVFLIVNLVVNGILPSTFAQPVQQSDTRRETPQFFSGRGRKQCSQNSHALFLFGQYSLNADDAAV